MCKDHCAQGWDDKIRIREANTLSTRFEEAGLWSVCMNRKTKPCTNPQNIEPSNAIRILFRPDANRVSQREVDLVRSMLHDVLEEMTRLAAEDAAKSSPSCMQVEPPIDSGIQCGHKQ